jgi:hypothetical protein
VAAPNPERVIGFYLMEDLNRRGIRSKVRIAKNGRKSGGNPFFRGARYVLLSNPIYVGEIRHKGVLHPGLHESIGPAAVGKDATAAAEPGGSERVASNEICRESAHGQAIR